MKGEFTTAMESLTEERTGLLNQMSAMRLKLAEAQSEKEAAERQWRSNAEEEATKIHAKYVKTKEEGHLEVETIGSWQLIHSIFLL